MKTDTIVRLKVILLTGFAVCFAFPHATIAQTNYTVDSNSVINISGTAPLHKWGMTARSFTGNATFRFLADEKLDSITKFSLNLPVYNLKSEDKGIEKSAYKALKADKFGNIAFELTSAKFKSSGFQHYLILLQGNLTIAGVTQETTLKASVRVNEDGTLLCSGSLPIFMSDYNIERPSILLGTLKVSDVLVLNYNLLLVK